MNKTLRDVVTVYDQDFVRPQPQDLTPPGTTAFPLSVLIAVWRNQIF